MEESDKYLKAATALVRMATESGTTVVSNSMASEIFLLKLIHYLISYGIEPLRGSVQNKIDWIQSKGVQTSFDSVITAKEAASQQFLYLVHD